MGKFQVDDMLRIHQSVYTTDCTQLQSACVTALASSALDNLTLDKEFSGAALERVKKLRVELGNHISHLAPLQEMQCKRIHRHVIVQVHVFLLLSAFKLSFFFFFSYLHLRRLFIENECFWNRALDSDDVELVRMLVDEKKLDLDGAHGLHYAAAFCHPRTLAHLLDLDIAGN
jgi:regulatory protein NPR1